jgi:hypothetical protein
MAQMDISAFEYFLPLLSFLVVFIICLFSIKKFKLIENTFAELFVSFAIAIIFVSAAGPRTFILTIIPWFAVALMGLFLVLALGGFIGTKDFPSEKIGMAFIIILAVIFVVTGFFLFFGNLAPYMPGFTNLSGNPGNPVLLRFFNWFYSAKVMGALLLLGVGILVSWIVVKAK